MQKILQGKRTGEPGLFPTSRSTGLAFAGSYVFVFVLVNMRMRMVMMVMFMLMIPMGLTAMVLLGNVGEGEKELLQKNTLKDVRQVGILVA